MDPIEPPWPDGKSSPNVRRRHLRSNTWETIVTFNLKTAGGLEATRRLSAPATCGDNYAVGVMEASDQL